MFALPTLRPPGGPKLADFDSVFAVVEFTPTGEIVSANAAFLEATGYRLDELKGAPHRRLVDAREADRPSWDALGRGEFAGGEFRLARKDGGPIFLRGVYMPTRDRKGRVAQVFLVALDVTAERLAALDAEAKLDAVARAQGVVELAPDGTILAMNDVLLGVLGYEAREVIGKPHAMLLDPDEAQSPDYAAFWDRLRAGEPIAGTFRRRARDGKTIAVHGAYSPLRDVDGRVVKVFKLAKDLTDLRTLGAGLAAVAAGDLACRIERPFHADFEQVRTDFNGTVDAVSGMLRRIFELVIVFGDAADRMATASESLAQRTEEQAANIEEAAASIDEVAATVNMTSASASRADAAVERAKQDAMKGGDVVGRAIDAMGRIEKSSKQIGSIIGVVDEIAFQTNLLALNAGVEAARAGEAGRGFAVVAAEVRVLAQRSAEAAREIKALVNASAGDVATGVGLVRETGDSLKIIVDHVVELNALIRSITDGAQEEATILAEVNSSVTRVDSATQQNSNMAEEASLSIKALKAQIDKLLGVVNEFKLPDGGLPQLAAENLGRTSRAA